MADAAASRLHHSPIPMALQALALAYRDSPRSPPPPAGNPDPAAMAAAAAAALPGSDWALLDRFVAASPIPRSPIPLMALKALAQAYRDFPCSPPPAARNPDPPAKAAAAAAFHPDSALLDRFILLRDDTSFPADDPTAASSTNSLGDEVRVCFQLHHPPRPSAIYLSWASCDFEFRRFDVVAAHRDAVLFQMAYRVPVPGREYPRDMYDYFLYRAGGAAAPSLHRLPSVYGTLPEFWAMFKEGSFRYTDQNLRRRECLDMGILRRGEDDVALAELQIIRRNPEPELHVLIPSSSESSRWQSKKMRIVHGSPELDLEPFLWDWSADTVVPFGRYLCWVDYCQAAILLCDVFSDSRELRYLALPATLPGMRRRGFGRSLADMFMTVGVNEETGVMKFVRVVGGHGQMIGSEYIPGSGFVAESWTLDITDKDEMVWKKGAVVTSHDLLLTEAFAKLSPMPLQFPCVCLSDPNIVYFVMASEGHAMRGIEYGNTWLVAIDMPNRTIKSSFQYIKSGEEGSSDEYTSFVMEKSCDFKTFIPSELPKYLKKLKDTSVHAMSSRKRSRILLA